MITWFILWPLLLLPTVAISVLGFLPKVEFLNQAFGGGLVRQWFVNQILLPVLPSDWAWVLVEWYQLASTGQEMGLHFLIALNINAALLPVLYFIGEGLIRFNSWATTSAFRAQRKLIQ